MADELLFDDIKDYPYNSFTGVLTPFDGYTEKRTVPSIAPYIIDLYQYPFQEVPSNFVVNTDPVTTPLIEVSKTTSPATGQYRVNYDERGAGQIEFNSAQGSLIMDIGYEHEGTIFGKMTIESIVFNGTNFVNVIASGTLDVAGAVQFDTTLNVDGLTTLEDTDIKNQGLILLEDRKTTGTFGGSSSSGAWNTRVLNTEVKDTNNHCTLAGNQFTLQPGIYFLFASSPFFNSTGDVTIRIYNTSDAFVEGISAKIGATTNNATAIVNCIIEIATAKTFELQYYSSGSRATSGLGITNIGAPPYDKYSTVQLNKIK